jgi:hypothetical protein
MIQRARKEPRSAARTPGKEFTDHLARSARIEWVLAETMEERQAIFRLRYQAYLREGLIPANPFARFTDPADGAENSYLFGVYIDGKLASSIRLHVGCRHRPAVPSLDVFPDALQPLFDAGRVIIDCTHLVADETLSCRYPTLPYITLRPCMLAAEYFRGDDVLAAVGSEHQVFYRGFNYQLLGKPQQYKWSTRPLSLMALHFPMAANQLYEKYPLLRSSGFERDRLFAIGSRNGSLPGIKTYVVRPRGTPFIPAPSVEGVPVTEPRRYKGFSSGRARIMTFLSLVALRLAHLGSRAARGSRPQDPRRPSRIADAVGFRRRVQFRTSKCRAATN